MPDAWTCPKCGNAASEQDVITSTGSGFSRFFNVQNRRFTAVTCTQCRYTELYKGESSTLSNILDFFGN